jgi:hypothetical protein
MCERLNPFGFHELEAVSAFELLEAWPDRVDQHL